LNRNVAPVVRKRFKTHPGSVILSEAKDLLFLALKTKADSSLPFGR
jgi:hypothetical protein